MNKIKVIVNNPLFKIGMALAVACILYLKKCLYIQVLL